MSERKKTPAVQRVGLPESQFLWKSSVEHTDCISAAALGDCGVSQSVLRDWSDPPEGIAQLLSARSRFVKNCKGSQSTLKTRAPLTGLGF